MNAGGGVAIERKRWRAPQDEVVQDVKTKRGEQHDNYFYFVCSK